jgi:diguanylate cyclase (GGDEF)-like protein
MKLSIRLPRFRARLSAAAARGVRPARRPVSRETSGPGRRSLMRLPLIAPIVLLVALTSAAMVGVEEHSFRTQAREQLEARGAAGLREVAGEIGQRRRSHETFARLVADTPGLDSAVSRGDGRALRRLLGPLRTNQRGAFEEVTVYDAEGGEIVALGPPKGDRVDARLFDSARSGRTAAEAVVDPAGLVVAAATPVGDPHRVVGVLVVASTLTDSDLVKLKHQGAVELAFYQGRSLVTASTRRAELLARLRTVDFSAERLRRFNDELDAFQLYGTAHRLPGGRLLALAPSRDLHAFARQRRLVTGGAIALVLAGLPLIWFFVRGGVVRPLRAMATATDQMVQGDYSDRVSRSRIPELDVLAAGINHLAERVEDQLRDLTHQAFHDSLTTLSNRALFLDRLQHTLTTAKRRGDSAAVIFLDLDDFKLVNDTLGHQVADQLLVAVADRLRGQVRREDTLARLGGDEFTVLVDDVAEVADALAVVERIQGVFETPFHVGDRELFVNASVGLTISAGRTDADVLLSEADMAMYRAKTNGKARCELFDEAMTTQLEERLALQTELRHALDRDEFRVHYQPIVDLATGEIVEVEALVRWQHPERGLVPPLRFIPAAEQTGLIIPLGLLILAKACAQVSEWQAQRTAPLRVSVNLSPRQFQDAGLVADVANVLEETGLDPRLLKLEITEGSVIDGTESTLHKMQALRELGVELVIDDFGTGYSSLSYLRRFPVQGLKIDKSFIDGIGRNPQDEAIVEAIISFAKALGLKVTGEGVEERPQADRLQVLGCDLAQGYHFGKPLDGDAVADLIALGPALLAQEVTP